MDQLRIEYMPMSALRAMPKNPKAHDLELISGSIYKFSFNDPVTIDERTGYLCEGHGRLEAMEAARAAGNAPPQHVQVGPDGDWLLPTVRGVSFETEDDLLAYLVVHNQATTAGGFDQARLRELVAGIQARGRIPLPTLGFSPTYLQGLLRGLPGGGSGRSGPTLADDFLAPPFSVLDARQGYWKERKAQWIALGIRSEIGRGVGVPGGAGENTAWLKRPPPTGHPGSTPTPTGGGLTKKLLGQRAPRPGGPGADAPAQPFTAGKYAGGDAWRSGSKPPTGTRAGGEGHAPGAGAGGDAADWQGTRTRGARALTYGAYEDGRTDEVSGKIRDARPASGTSIFDPVLCELAYRWFNLPDGHVLDPFAGGSVRGVVAAVLGMPYTGIDLSGAQLEANRQQWAEIGPRVVAPLAGARPLTDATRAPAGPCWIQGDSRNVAQLAPGEYDLVFTCPPYADLERYSDDPADLSTLPYPKFRAAYRKIIAASVALLRPQRFAVVVVGEVRGKDGTYYGLVPDTVAAFRDAGARLYNEAILVTAIGSLPVRTRRAFEASRKLGKAHQNVLIFWKGDPRQIKRHFPKIDIPKAVLEQAADAADEEEDEGGD